MQDERRIGRLDRGEGLFVPLDAEVWTVPTLQHDLGGAEVDSLSTATQDLVERTGPTLLVLGRPVEGAELAGSHTDIGVVDVAIDDVRRDVGSFGEPPPARCVGSPAERMQRSVAIDL